MVSKKGVQFINVKKKKKKKKMAVKTLKQDEKKKKKLKMLANIFTNVKYKNEYWCIYNIATLFHFSIYTHS